MLEKLDLTLSIEKADYHAKMDKLERRLGELQRQAREHGVPIVIVFDGWGAAGKGTLLNRLILALDPRGITVSSIKPPTEEELLRPFLWRFWTKLPENGRIALFDRSWYSRVLVERIDRIINRKTVERSFDEINAFERQLTDDRTVIVKFFLHISKKEQKKRFEKLEADPVTSWKVTQTDWIRHRQYGQYLEAIEEMIEKTSTPAAPWTVVEAQDQRYAAVKIFKTLVDTIESAIEQKLHPKLSRHTLKLLRDRKSGKPTNVLDKIDLSHTMTRDAYHEKLKECQKRVWELEHDAFRKRLPVAIMFEGCDAAGKGGAIRRLAQSMDPRGYEVVPFAAPNDVEKRHHYLWRFWNRLPKAGHLTIFDRSWYGRVLVERVEGFAREDEWARAYDEIVETEKQWADSGMIIIKFWLHIDQKEQLRRFNARKNNPDKQWKITEEDWRNRKKWDKYKIAVDEMIAKTSTPFAKWTIVEGNSKEYARIKILKTVIKTMEDRL
ncbi:MAG: hypothetical protein MUF22_07930 [Chitinispirillaceae bacterium]|jgi:polyphosphate:AMP phosphotransferase|nr:hypothetical protein [Chitinispirillaceae bacterium]